MSKHIHADLMLQYAQDAMTTDKPWELWEWRFDDDVAWRSFLRSRHPTWGEELQYRRKPETMKINGFDVPEPVREPLEKGQKYFLSSPIDNSSPNFHWSDDSSDRLWLERGLIHLTREAADLHAKALLSFTEVQP